MLKNLVLLGIFTFGSGAAAQTLNYDADGEKCNTVTRFSFENGKLYAMTEDVAYFPTTFTGPEDATIQDGPFENTYYVTTQHATYTVIDNTIIPYKIESVDQYREALKEGNVDVVTMEKCEE